MNEYECTCSILTSMLVVYWESILGGILSSILGPSSSGCNTASCARIICSKRYVWPNTRYKVHVHVQESFTGMCGCAACIGHHIALR